MNYKIIAVFIIISSCITPKSKQLSIDKWTYIQIDSTRGKWGDYAPRKGLKYFGLNFDDVNNDGYQDILAGKYIYLNPAKNMEGHWQRVDIHENVDGMLFANVDDDEFADIISQALPNVLWHEATDSTGTSWTSKIIDSVPITDHINAQGYLSSDIVKGGKKELLFTGGKGIYACKIPENPDQYPWGFKLIVETGSSEGFATGDIDNDGDLDIICGDTLNKLPTRLFLALNPGNINEIWEKHEIGRSQYKIDRVEIADFDGDSMLDVAVTEEVPVQEPIANVMWFKAPKNPVKEEWKKTILKTQYATNNMDAGDIDNDGNIDIVTQEHKGKEFNLQIWQNNGHGIFTESVIDTGKETHLGAQLVDLDNDGDIDIVSTGWVLYKYMHVWRNDAIVKE